MGTTLSHPRVDLTGRTILVTGANTGIGYVTAKTLASMGGRVTVACRSEEKGLAAIQRMRDELPTQTLDLTFGSLDLSSLEATKTFAERYVTDHEHLHLLVLNAGCSMPANGGTVDGYEAQYQVNFLSHFLLTLVLMPLLRKTLAAIAQEAGPSDQPAEPAPAAAGDEEADSAASTPSPAESAAAASESASPPASGAAAAVMASKEVRVIHVSSAGHALGKADFAVQAPAEGVSGTMDNYYRSKLFQVMISHALQRHFNEPGLAFHSLHPGVVKTDISRDFSGFWKHITSAMGGVGSLRTPEDGAQTTLSAALDTKWDGRQPTYFDSCAVKAASRLSRDESQQSRLWNVALGQLQTYLSDKPDLNIDWEQVESSKPKEAPAAATATAATSAGANETSSEVPADVAASTQDDDAAPVAGDDEAEAAAAAAAATAATATAAAATAAATAAPEAAAVGEQAPAAQAEQAEAQTDPEREPAAEDTPVVAAEDAAPATTDATPPEEQQAEEREEATAASCEAEEDKPADTA